MKKMKRDRVPVIEDTLGLNLATLQAMAKKVDSDMLAITWQGTTGLVLLQPERMTLVFSGRTVSAEIATVKCLNGRLRPLLKCSRAHEGNFQTLYLRGGELACRNCHKLRYRSNLASSKQARFQLARIKLMNAMGCLAGQILPGRRYREWDAKYQKNIEKLSIRHSLHYSSLIQQLKSIRGKMKIVSTNVFQTCGI